MISLSHTGEGRKAKLLLDIKSLSNLKWPKPQTQTSKIIHTDAPGQPPRKDTVNTIQENILGVQDGGKSSEFVATEIHTDTQVGKLSSNILTPKTTINLDKEWK